MIINGLPFFGRRKSHFPSFIALRRDVCFALILKFGVIVDGTQNNGAKKVVVPTVQSY
jgi:hypothetical protein